jgi:general secretion pathway protein H
MKRSVRQALDVLRPLLNKCVMKAGNKAKGFTLIELTLVLLISVLAVSAIAISISSGNESTQLKAISKELVSALRYARGQALISSQQISVAMDLSDNSYKISNRDKLYHFNADIEVTLVIADSEFDGDEVGEIRFFADGSSTGGRITLEWGELMQQIDINWLTAQVKIADETE